MNSTILYLISIFIHLLPETKCFGLKRVLYRLAGADIGKGTRIVSSAKIMGSGKLIIGSNTWIGHDALIICSSNIFIGSHCDIAPRVYIGTGTHIIDVNCEHVSGRGISLPISIGNGCWLCANSMILPGTTIGNKSILAAGAVAKGNIPSRELWGGCIAKKIKDL